jgi:hypothetical protein
LQTILRSMTNINLSNNETINTDHIRKALWWKSLGQVYHNPLSYRNYLTDDYWTSTLDDDTLDDDKWKYASSIRIWETYVMITDVNNINNALAVRCLV